MPHSGPIDMSLIFELISLTMFRGGDDVVLCSDGFGFEMPCGMPGGAALVSIFNRRDV